MSEPLDPLRGRRAFFQQTLALAAVVGANASCSRRTQGGAPRAEALPAAEPVKQAARAASGPRVGFAVVGLGKFATEQILPAFAACTRSRLVALVSGSPDKAKRIAEQYGIEAKNLYDYTNFDRIRENAAVDVVYVILPNSLHAQYSERAARAGKHVLCEKPMAVTAKECEGMIHASKAAGKKLMIAYRAQFEPHNLRAIQMVRRGEIGRVKTIIADHGRILRPEQPSDSWRAKRALAGGGSLVDIGIYSIQAARYITGEEPLEVSARTFSTPNDARFAEVEETVAFTLAFPSGVLANCTASYGHAEGKRYRVFGEKGYLDLDPATAYEGNVLRASKDGKSAELVEVPQGNQFAAQMDHLAECIQSGEEPKTPGEEGLRDVRILEAIYTAAREHRPVRFAANTQRG